MNILFLFADQMHAFAMGCMGNAEIQTPNLDRLAGEGTLFRHTYSNTPICTPFRGNLFTGRYASQTGIINNADPIPSSERTLAHALNDGGYRTSYVGKWHLGDKGNVAVPPELRAGFTDFIGYQCYNDFEDGVYFFDEQGICDERNTHRTEATTDIAIERLAGLAQRTAQEPFALFVSYQNPHYPLQPAPEYEALYSDQTLTRRPNAQEIDPFIPTFSPYSPRPKEDDPLYYRYGQNLDLYLRQYYAMVTQLDANIGRLMRAIDEFGLRDDTVIVFTSDHGDLQGSHGQKNKSQPWEESTRIPLIVRVPGGPAGQVIDSLVSGIDFYPSCLGYAELPSEPTAEGIDFSPLTRGEPQTIDQAVFAEFKTWAMVRVQNLKLVVEKETLSPTHFYDLAVDPYEMTNLVDSSVYEDIRQQCRKQLEEWYLHVTGA